MKTARQAKRRGTTRPPYARELHDIAVRALRAGRLPAELARETGVPTTTLGAWLHAADLVAALQAAPATWFTSKDPASWWPPNVDHHSAQHRRDIERALERARPR